MNHGTHHANCINDFAEAILEQHFVKAHQLLAPWLQLQSSSTYLAYRFESWCRQVCQLHGYVTTHRPVDFFASLADATFPDSCDGSHSSLAPEVTRQNFVQTMPLEFCASSRLNFDLYAKLHLIVIEDNGELLIGRLEWLEPETQYQASAAVVSKRVPNQSWNSSKAFKEMG
jgi:hypothetical protein